MKAWELAETSYHNIQVSGKKKQHFYQLFKLLKSNSKTIKKQ